MSLAQGGRAVLRLARALMRPPAEDRVTLYPVTLCNATNRKESWSRRHHAEYSVKWIPHSHDSGRYP